MNIVNHSHLLLYLLFLSTLQPFKLTHAAPSNTRSSAIDHIGYGAGYAAGAVERGGNVMWEGVKAGGNWVAHFPHHVARGAGKVWQWTANGVEAVGQGVKASGRWVLEGGKAIGRGVVTSFQGLDAAFQDGRASAR